MDEELEMKKLAEECGELVQILMKTSIWGLHNFNPKTGIVNEDALVDEMGDVLCHLKRVANSLNISWDKIQQRSYTKNSEYNKQH